MLGLAIVGVVSAISLFSVARAWAAGLNYTDSDDSLFD